MWRAVEKMKSLPLFPEERAHQLAGGSRFLTSAKLKLVDACNLRCFMCDYWHGRREDELDTDTVLRVLRELRELGCEKIHFTGGEIFMRKDAIELLGACADLGMRTCLTTNGTLLDKARIRALVRMPVRSVTLSIDSPSANLHDRVRGRRGSHAKTTRALDTLLERRGKKTRIRLNTVVSRHNFRSLVELPAFLRDRRVDGLLLIPMDAKPMRGGTSLPIAEDLRNDSSMTANHIEEYNAFVAPALAEAVRVPGFDPWIFGRARSEIDEAARQRYALGHYRDHMCHVPWFHTLVGPTGDVYPCCMGHRQLEPLGNVRRQSLSEIWSGEKYRAFRRSMTEGRPAVCHHCDDFLPENRAMDQVLSARA